MRTMSPASTRGRNASCCDLLNLWISSTNTMVRRFIWRRECSATAMTSLISLMPASTALNATNRARVAFAINLASVVLPVPGGPHRMIERRRSCSIASRSGRPGARMSCWPTNSSKLAGRMRSARGVPAAFAEGVSVDGSSKRDMLPLQHSGLALSVRFIEYERGGDADVERFDGSLHGNCDAAIDLPKHFVRHACAFAAENQRRRGSEIGVEQ